MINALLNIREEKPFNNMCVAITNTTKTAFFLYEGYYENNCNVNSIIVHI